MDVNQQSIMSCLNISLSNWLTFEYINMKMSMLAHFIFVLCEIVNLQVFVGYNLLSRLYSWENHISN